MPIHIGQQIKKKADDLKISQADLGERISRTKQTVGDIFKRKSIDTDLLLSICRALEFDFFALYYQEEPLKSLKEKIDEPILQELKETKSELVQKEKRIIDLEKTITANEKLIQLLEKRSKKNEVSILALLIQQITNSWLFIYRVGNLNLNWCINGNLRLAIKQL